LSLLPLIPQGVSLAQYYFCVGAAVLITGISKAGFGGGVGILAIPLMAIGMGTNGTTHMMGVMLPLLVACDLLSSLHHLGQYDSWRRFAPLLLGMIVGILAGTAILWGLSGINFSAFNMTMSGIVGVVCLIVVLMQVYRLTGREVPTLPPSRASALTIGGVAGTVSTLNHAAGPIVQIYLMQREEDKLNKRKLVGTLLLYFLIGNTLKLPTYCLLPVFPDGRALINAQTLHDSIWFIPLIPIGTLIGAWMHHRVPERPFAAIMYVFAALTAGQMIYKVIQRFSPAWASRYAIIGTAFGLAICIWAWLKTRQRMLAPAQANPA
jgi:uncharacterized membrane protein YfcA